MNENLKLQHALRFLNPLQLEAVTSHAESLQIVAGPGSGKTKVLTCRVSYLISERHINPSDIIVVTFTKKAAIELQERLNSLIGSSKASQLQIGTFHSICISILRRNARIVDLEPDFKVVDDRKRKEIIRALLKDECLPVKYAGRQIKADVILAAIEAAKDRGENWIKYQNLYSGGSSQYLSILSVYYMAYEAVLRQHNIIDFGGLILKTCELLRMKDDVFYNIDCVLVDEFQDTSTSQYDFISLLLAQTGHRTITTVGDPDQSIYGWRAAKSRVFKEMQKDYPNTKVVHLEQNYRSTVMVVKSSNHVILQDAERMDKALYTRNPIGIPISLITTLDEKKQAEYVAYEIGKVINYSKGLIQYKDIAVLMRANYSSRQFERTFRVHKIPFTLKGGDRFFNRMEIKDMLGYLRFTSNPFDRTSFVKIINVPERNIRKVTINRILAMNESFGCNLFDTIEIFLVGEKRTAIGDRNELQGFLDLCRRIHKKILAEEHIADILKYIYKETNYYNHLVQHHWYDHVGRWKNLGELVTISGSKKEMGGYEDEEPGEDIMLVGGEDPILIAKIQQVEVSSPSETPKVDSDLNERQNSISKDVYSNTGLKKIFNEDDHLLHALSEEEEEEAFAELLLKKETVSKEKAFSMSSLEEEAFGKALLEEKTSTRAFSEEALTESLSKETLFSEGSSNEKSSRALLQEEAYVEHLPNDFSHLKEEEFANRLLKEEAYVEILQKETSQLEEDFAIASLEDKELAEILSKENSFVEAFSAEDEFADASLKEAFAEILIAEEAFLNSQIQSEEHEPKLLKKEVADTQSEDLKANIPPKNESRTQSLQEFESALPLNFERDPPPEEENATDINQEQGESVSKGIQNVVEFLNYCDSCENQKQQTENEGGSVTLSTIHAAKGLEWPCVYIVTCTDGIIPASGDENEEKRILYVAMTRSKFLLYCISPIEIGDWGRRKRAQRTPFLDHMDKKLYSTSSPIWNQELRKMLADTIHRPTPKDEDFLNDSNLPKNSSSQPTPKPAPITAVTRSSTGTGFALYQPYSSSTQSKTKVTTIPTYNTSYKGTTYTSQQYSSTSSFTGLKRALDFDEENIFTKFKKGHSSNNLSLYD